MENSERRTGALRSSSESVILSKAMMTTFSIAGTCASILSVVMLIRHGFDVGFSAPLALLLSFYESVVGLTLDWANPLLMAALYQIAHFWSVDLYLHDHWKHVFILIWLYFAADSRLYWERGRYASAIFLIFFGLGVALAASLGAGAVPIGDQSFWIVVFPAVGFAFYEAVKSPMSAWFYRRRGETWWQTCNYYLINFSLASVAAGVIAYWSGVLIYDRTANSRAGLIALLVFIGVIVSRNLLVGARYADSNEASMSGSWRSRFEKSATARLGLLLLGIFTGAFLFVVCNAGLKLAGL